MQERFLQEIKLHMSSWALEKSHNGITAPQKFSSHITKSTNNIFMCCVEQNSRILSFKTEKMYWAPQQWLLLIVLSACHQFRRLCLYCPATQNNSYEDCEDCPFAYKVVTSMRLQRDNTNLCIAALSIARTPNLLSFICLFLGVCVILVQKHCSMAEIEYLRTTKIKIGEKFLSQINSTRAATLDIFFFPYLYQLLKGFF